ncbi:MAG: hypothetical protein SOV19_01915 [Eubacteriales bacterium]|nr:hypothetical protein [Christensenellaceae bacterium]MDY2747437.1 hypothetical protein [Eubacteriales bacterium]
MKRTKRVFAIIIGLTCLLVGSVAIAASINVTSDPGALGAEGGSVQLSISIANDSEYAMENISVSNNGTRFFETSGVIIAPGETTAFSQSVSIPAAMLGQPIGFDIAWTENGEQKYSSASVTVLNSGAGLAEAALSVSVKASSSQASRGESITLTYTITNSGITPVSGVSLTDKEIGGRQAMVSGITVEPGTPYVYIHEFTMGSSTVVSVPVVTYTGADGSTVTVTGSEKTLGMVNSKISVSVTQGAASEEGQQFTIALTNNGNQRISKIKVTDELGNAVNSDAISLAIGESRTLTYTVPTTETRNVVFNISGIDATNTNYSDHTETYVVRKYIDPSLIGISFSAEVASPLDSAGSISLNFTVENTGSMDMQNLKLSESEYGLLYMLESVPRGTQTINQKMSIGSPRDLIFKLEIEDPSGNIYTYNAYIKADYVGVEAAPTSTPSVTTEEDVLNEVGGSISSALRTVLIVLIILTVIAGIALIILDHQEKEERKRIARRRAQREKMMRAQLEEEAKRQAALHSRISSGSGDDLGSTRISSGRPAERSDVPSGDTRIR